MKIQLEKVVRIPISEIVNIIMNENNVDVSKASPEIIGDFLVFQLTDEDSSSTASLTQPKQRRSKKKRNRMKTRGWNIVGKIESDTGQISNVYKPFVKALKGKNLEREEQLKIVEKILRSNKNNPSLDSIEYYLQTTLKYIDENP